MKKIAVIISCVGLLSGCAKSSDEITAQYISPMQYDGYSCKQLQREMTSVSRRASDLGGQVDKTASDDKAQMAVGLVLFWPTLFFLDGNTPQAAEYGRLKGEFEALETASIHKNCGVKVEPIKSKPVKVEKEATPDYPTSKKR